MNLLFDTRTLTAWVLLVATLGCADTSQPDYTKLGLVEISGRITLDDQPLSNAAVYFHDRPNRVYSYGVTDSNGHYKLMFDSRMSGVLPGEKEVEITSAKNPVASEGDSSAAFDSDEDETEGSEQGAAAIKPKELVAAKYNSRTTLKYVVSESSDSVDFNLSSK